MKSLEWQGPEVRHHDEKVREYFNLFERLGENNSERCRYQKHADFRRWQDACVMNMIFGDNYVTTPEIPKGYEEYAKWWRDSELKAYK